MQAETLTQAQTKAGAKHGVGILFGGNILNVASMAAAMGLSRPFLSRLLSGDRELSLVNAQKMAAHLGVTLEEFAQAYNERVELVRKNREDIIDQHLERRDREINEDAKRIRKGLPPIPRLPGLRA